jgi:hypothetical protein
MKMSHHQKKLVPTSTFEKVKKTQLHLVTIQMAEMKRVEG